MRGEGDTKISVLVDSTDGERVKSCQVVPVTKSSLISPHTSPHFSSQNCTYADGRVLVVVAVRLARDLGGADHAVAGVGEAVVLHHGPRDGRVGREPEPAVADDGRFETVHGCKVEKIKLRGHPSSCSASK